MDLFSRRKIAQNPPACLFHNQAETFPFSRPIIPKYPSSHAQAQSQNASLFSRLDRSTPRYFSALSTRPHHPIAPGFGVIKGLGGNGPDPHRQVHVSDYNTISLSIAWWGMIVVVDRGIGESCACKKVSRLDRGSGCIYLMVDDHVLQEPSTKDSIFTSSLGLPRHPCDWMSLSFTCPEAGVLPKFAFPATRQD